MANTNAPFGFKPVGKIGQNGDNQGLSQYLIADNSSTTIYQGDAVIMASSGTIEQASAGSTILGVFWGAFISKDPSTGKPKYTNYYSQTNVASGEEIQAFIYDDPFERFEVQADDGAIAATDVGMCFDLNVGTGSTVNGISGMTLDVGTSAAAGAQLKVVGFSKSPENEVGAYAKTVVQINEHFWKATAGI